MINVICGFSGSGKTTYALKNKKPTDAIIDMDLLQDAIVKYNDFGMIKDLQIQIANYFISRNVDIWYVTCFPNFDELELFKNCANFIWINTSMKKSLENIYRRNRNGDLDDIENIKKYNLNVSNRYYTSKIPFKVIDVFESDERW